MLKFLGNLLTGGAVNSLENIAKEWIDTAGEKAEAAAVYIKALDPNGAMRRQISKTVSSLYVLYVLIMLLFLILQAFGWGDTKGVSLAIDSIKELFVPITTSFTMIVGASFGVNGINSSKGQ